MCCSIVRFVQLLPTLWLFSQVPDVLLSTSNTHAPPQEAESLLGLLSQTTHDFHLPPHAIETLHPATHQFCHRASRSGKRASRHRNPRPAQHRWPASRGGCQGVHVVWRVPVGPRCHLRLQCMEMALQAERRPGGRCHLREAKRDKRRTYLEFCLSVGSHVACAFVRVSLVRVHCAQP